MENATLSCVDEPTSLTGSSATDVVLSVCLLVLSGLFSGLTLGLMSLDVSGLDIVISGGDDDEKEYARTILPLRQRGNLLLCTLLLGNTLVNAMIAILSASFTSGLVGALLSTGFIVIFGEIMPQSICSRHGLYVGAKTVNIVKMFVVLLYPVARPIAWVLDYALGEEMGTIFNKQELERLVEMHVRDARAELNDNEGNLLRGALKFSEGTVGEIMTHRQIKSRIMAGTGKHETGIFMLDVNGKLDFNTMLEMHKRGHTRVPVCDGDPNNPETAIVGLMLTKDLMLVDPEDEVPITALLQFCGRDIMAVPDNLSLDKMLDIFKASHTHLFFVQPASIFRGGELQEVNLEELSEFERYNTIKRSISMEMDRRRGEARSTGTQEKLTQVIGIITMEDVLEELIQAEIIDEYDQFEDNHRAKQVTRGTKEIAEMEEREAFFRAMVGSKGYKEKILSEEETNAVVSFLCLHVEPFRAVTDLTVLDGKICDGGDGAVTLARVREMLAMCRVEELDIDDGERLLQSCSSCSVSQ